MTADRFDDLVQPFAAAIFSLCEARSGSLELTKFQDARYREAIATLIRKACDVVYPAVRTPEISAAANAAAESLGVDLRQETWHSQKKFDPGYKVFHYEHMRPVGAVLAEAATTESVDEVVDVLRRTLRLAWITKEENKTLTSLGFVAKRPDPDAAYRAAGIQLVSVGDPQPSSDAPEAERPRAVQPTTHHPVTRQANPTSLPRIVDTSNPRRVDDPREPGFMPISPGETFTVAQLGMCLGGVVQVHTDDGVGWWSVGDDRTLFDMQCRCLMARTRRGEHGFREVGMFNPLTGALLLQPRFPHAGSDGGGRTLSFEGSVIQLAPSMEPREPWAGDLQTLLARAVQHTIGNGEQLRVETGGWDGPSVPFCSVEMAFTEELSPVLYFEASPAPAESRWWSDRMQRVDDTTVRLKLHAKDFAPEQVALLLWDAIEWDGVSPWDLVMTYVKMPKSVVST